MRLSSALTLLALFSAIACRPPPTPSGWAGDYDATFSAAATFTLPDTLPPGTLLDTGVLTVTDEGEGALRLTFHIRDQPRAETVSFQLAGLTTASASGTHCFVAAQPFGDIRTTCCEQCTASRDGETLTQSQVGRFHGAAPDGTNDYAGTYSGQWTGIRR